MSWVYLVLAGLFEIGWPVGLKMAQEPATRGLGVAIAVLSVACGADDWCDMATFAKVKLVWLKTFLELPGGAPSHDTFRRV